MATNDLDAVKAAIRDLAAVVDVVIVNRGNVSHVDRDLRGRLQQIVASLRPSPAALPDAP